MVIRFLMVICLLGLSSLGFAKSANTADDAMVYASSKVVDEARNWYQVSPLLYRSEQPLLGQGQSLRDVGITSVVNLRFFDRDDDQENLGEDAFVLVNRPLLTWSIAPEEVANILFTIRNLQKNGAVLVHCYHGSDRTGLIVGMYQIVYENKPIQDAYDEMVNGPYRFSPFWVNIGAYFTEAKVNEVKAQLAILEQAARTTQK